MLYKISYMVVHDMLADYALPRIAAIIQHVFYQIIRCEDLPRLLPLVCLLFHKLSLCEDKQN